jgi:triacylglycerol lipase
MKSTNYIMLVLIFSTNWIACKNVKKDTPAALLTPKEIVNINEKAYNKNITAHIDSLMPQFKVVFLPKEVNGNFAFIIQKKNTEQYSLIIRGSVMDVTETGYQNFILQDFNIFNMHKWDYTDSVKEAYIADGMYLGFKNLLQLNDTTTQLSIVNFIENKIPSTASLVISGHSLGGNLATVMASYLKKELKNSVKNNMQLITFGAPAAGNKEFVVDLENKFPNAQRYAIDKDIACSFPDLTAIKNASNLIGLDSTKVLKGAKVNGAQGTVGELINVGISILDNLNIIPENKKYRQSSKHLKMISTKNLTNKNNSNTQLFENAFYYHSIKTYANLIQ